MEWLAAASHLPLHRRDHMNSGAALVLQLQIAFPEEYQWPFGPPAGMKVGLYMTFNGAGGSRPLKEGKIQGLCPSSRKAANTTVVLGGVVVISGPTENALYRLGRRLPGNRYTGDDHVSTSGASRQSAVCMDPFSESRHSIAHCRCFGCSRCNSTNRRRALIFASM